MEDVFNRCSSETNVFSFRLPQSYKKEKQLRIPDFHNTLPDDYMPCMSPLGKLRPDCTV